MIVCNYVDADWLVVLVMSLAFFGKGIGALGWAVVADTSPKEAGGMSGALFNTFGNHANAFARIRRGTRRPPRSPPAAIRRRGVPAGRGCRGDRKAHV